MIESAQATEIFISAVPTKNAPLEKQAQDIFTGIREILTSRKACILQERVFAMQSAMETISAIRSQMYGALDDGVAPSLLVCKEGAYGSIAGIQVHAVRSESRPEVLNLDQKPCGRIVRVPGCTYLMLSNISAPHLAGADEQAREMLEKSESILKQFGQGIKSVPRTWMWLGDILSWYDDFNKVRNTFFTERGALGPGNQQSLPASTGIGLGPANGCSCSMDLAAVLEPADSIQYLEAGGMQQSAFKYGSAFSRGTRAITPAGETIFVSGTASIDACGATTHIGDAAGQISTTIENVQAVLKDMDCTDKDVVQVMAYCKTADIEKIFGDFKKKLAWPWITMICDICRDDLLFEIEAAAMVGK